jgi:hypothetical protein
MTREVTLENLNRAFIKELFSYYLFWIGVIIYIMGIGLWFITTLIGGIFMLVGVLTMINADWVGRKRVVKRLQWKK